MHNFIGHLIGRRKGLSFPQSTWRIEEIENIKWQPCWMPRSVHLCPLNQWECESRVSIFNTYILICNPHNTPCTLMKTCLVLILPPSPRKVGLWTRLKSRNSNQSQPSQVQRIIKNRVSSKKRTRVSVRKVTECLTKPWFNKKACYLKYNWMFVFVWGMQWFYNYICIL